MKSLKKILSIFAAFMMVVGLTMTSASAEGETGSITLKNAKDGVTYTAYKIFNASVANTTTNVNPGVNEEDSRTAAYYTDNEVVKYFGGASDSVDKATNGMVVTTDLFKFTKTSEGSWNVEAIGNATQIANGIKNLLADTTKTIPASITTKNATGANGQATWTDLDLGYYYVADNTGAVVAVNTTSHIIEIADKNIVPDPDKKVSTTADPNGGDKSSAKVGDVVTFTVTVNVEPGLRQFSFEDTMGTGLDFYKEENDNTAGVTIAGLPNDVKVTPTVNGNKISFSLNETQLKSFTGSTLLTVTYKGIINKDAVQPGSTENNVVVKYGPNDSDTDSDKVIIYLGQAELTKTSEDGTTKLDGAEFKVYTSKTGGAALKFTLVPGTSEEGGTPAQPAYYYLDPNGSVDTLPATNGSLIVKGLSEGSYWFEETKAPDGYNIKTERTEFKVDKNGSGETITAENMTGLTTPEHTIVNNKGTVLPSTGGMGTTMIYIAGAILMVGAAIIFVTNKRMKHE